MRDTLDILERLVAFQTVSADSNLSLIAFIRDYLTTRGFRLHQINDPTGKKAGLFATIGPDGPGGILLSGHTDVVPTKGQDWTRAPFALTREGDRVYGRGTTDMKGFVASMLVAADVASRLRLTQPLKLALSYDEEVGCVGIQQMIGDLESSIGLPDMAIVGEPTSMQVAIGHKGKAALLATCRGQSGHSALAPRFVNALHLASDLITGLRALQDDLAQNGHQDSAYDIPYSTVHVGTLSGGTALNIVPDTAILDLEYRHLAADRGADLHSRISDISNQIVQRYRDDFPDAQIEIDAYNAYPGLDVDPTASVVKDVQALAQTPGTTKVAFGTEAGFFDALGVPTVVCGPGSMAGQGHKPDEYIDCAELRACDAMLRRVVAKISE